jgi:hypothetical protein
LNIAVVGSIVVVACIVVTACQPAGSASAAPTTAAAATGAATTAAPATVPATTGPAVSTKPTGLPRVADLPLDGTCEDENTSCIGLLDAGKKYTTKVFTPATSFTMPNADFVNPFDTGGYFGLLSTRDIGDEIRFFRDARSFDKSAGDSVTDLALWIEAYDKLDVTPFQPVKIGGLSGVWMDIRIAADATNQDPGCPVQVCVPTLRGDDPVQNDPYQWHWDWGSAGLETQRLYLLDARDTIIAIFVDSRDGLTFDALTQVFDTIKATIAFK